MAAIRFSNHPGNEFWQPVQAMSDTFERRADEDQQQPASAVSDLPATQVEAPAPLAPGITGPRPGARRESSWRALRDPLLVGVLLAALVADQVTKQLVLNSLGPGVSWPEDGFFRFTFVRNDGTAFGLFQDNGALLTIISLAAVALIVYFYREAAMSSWFTRTALGLQIGGAAGNIIDRFRHGYVVDFLDVGPWPIFNIADSAIMVGIISLILYFTILGGRGRHISASADTGAGPSTDEGTAGHTGDAAVSDTASDDPPTEASTSPPESRD